MSRVIHITLILIGLLTNPAMSADDALPGTQPLTMSGDLASQMVDGIDQFLLRKIATSPDQRAEFWTNNRQARDNTGIERARKKLAQILGVRDARPESPEFELIATPNKSAEIQRVSDFRVLAVRWRAVGNIHGEGLLLEPSGKIAKNIIAIPDADQEPESLASSPYVLRLAASGCRVVIPALVSRQVNKRRNSELTDREYLYRSSFELGRQLTGYELQKVLAVIDWFYAQQTDRDPRLNSENVGVIGWGEGGRLALYAAALDDRIGPTCVSGYFGPRQEIWEEPIDRNVFGLLTAFGDAEIAGLKHDGEIVIDPTPGPVANVRTRGGAPYRLESFAPAEVEAEVARIPGISSEHVILARGHASPTVSDNAVELFAAKLGLQLAATQTALKLPVDPKRADRTIAEIEQFNQNLLAQSPYERKKFFEKLDVSSVEAHRKTVEWYREYFRNEVIGSFADKILPPNPRARKVFDNPKWTGYEVVLDVYPDVFAFGILLLPKGMEADEKRPVVVCQHGLEGRPRNVIENDQAAYHDYAAKLAERGFITFAPQNIYIFEDRFRTLQRKANPLGKTLFSVMVPQHQQITDWLATLPNVDPERIAFYGLSYGGKSAMRIPPLVDRYCLSICSADFNDWVWKNASTLSPYSYVWTGEYEIFEWDLGSTFNYAEMAALIAPRPFMVERGHFDGVAPDERVALEFAKVRHLYQAKLGVGDRCEIEFFVGPHTINGKGTFDFLHRHLAWPVP